MTCDVIAWVHRTDPEAWWNGPANGIGSAGALLLRQDAATVAHLREHYDQLIAGYRQPDGSLALPTRALLASATGGPAR